MDESIFDAREQIRKVWSRRNQHISIPKIPPSLNKMTAVMGAISSFNSELFYSLKHGYFNQQDTIHLFKTLLKFHKN